MVGALAILLILGLVGCWTFVWRHESFQTGNNASHDTVGDFDLRATSSGYADEGGVRGDDLQVEEVEPETGDGDDAGKVSMVSLQWTAGVGIGTHGRRKPKAPTTINLEFMDIRMLHIR